MSISRFMRRCCLWDWNDVMSSQ